MKIAVIGMGSMGPGMAARLARGGHEVAAYDLAPEALERAAKLQPMIATALDGLGWFRQFYPRVVGTQFTPMECVQVGYQHSYSTHHMSCMVSL